MTRSLTLPAPVSLKEFEEVRVEVEQGVFVGPPVVRNVVAGETIVTTPSMRTICPW